MNIVYHNQDNIIAAYGVHDPRASSGAGEDITSAVSATAQVYETDRTTTVGGSLSMTYLAQLDGVANPHWYAILEDDHAAVTDEGGSYSAKVRIVASSDRVFEDWVDFTVRRRM